MMTTETSTTITGAPKASGTSTNTASTPLAGSTPTGVLTAPIILKGYLRKLKTMRKKYFVLYGDCDAKLARLDYFDSEKKFKHSLNKNGCVAKRSIALKSCFNINKRVDTKQKFVIALYTKDDCFCVVFENEVEQDLWYKKILELQIGGDVIEGDQPRPTFEHVWDVHVQRKGLGESYGILGKYRLCITNTSLSLVRIGSTTNSMNENRVANVEFSLASIRRTGVLQRYFYLEVGRVSKTGAGEIWMETEDAYIAENMYQTILFAATKNKSSKEDNLAPMIRIRSSSANEASKPITMLSRRQTQSGAKPLNFSPSSEDSHTSLAQSESSSSACTVIMAPMHRQSSSITTPTQQELTKHTSTSASTIYTSTTAIDTATTTPATTTASCTSINYNDKENNSTSSNGSILGRERCDSLPTSRNRTNSEHNPQQPIVNTTMPPPRSIPSATSMRPHSMYNHRYSNSPPVNSYPLSPPSGACSTDGSSLSIDETDGFLVHSSTPDESSSFMNMKLMSSVNSDMVIPEENMEDQWYNDYMHGRNNNTAQSLSLPINNQNHINRKGSPAHPVGSAEGSSYMEMCSPCGSSPGDPTGNVYIAMSPGIDCTRSMYQGSSSAHSRASSLAEENTDGYVPMSAHAQDTYVEMDGHIQRTLHEGMSSAASSCSHHSSGTPSTDMRFSEYPLEKVISAFTQSEDDESTLDMRPTRTYSVGSRLEHNKRKLRVDVINAEHLSQNPRVRAFSVGSRAAKVPRSELYKTSLAHTQQAAAYDKEIFNNSTAVATASGKKGKKSNSAPILMKCPGSIDRMDDLMEIDFSKTSTTPVKTSSPVPVPKTKPRMCDYMSPRTRSSPSGYVEMKPIGMSSTQNEHDYLDMIPGGGGTTTGPPYILSCSPILRNLAGSSPKEISLKSLKINNNCDYIDMSPKTTSSSGKSMGSAKHNTISESPKTSSDDYLNMSPGEKMLDAVGSLPKSNASSSAPDGYMEMSWNQKNKNNEKRTSEEYINVSTQYSQQQQQAKSFTSANQDSRLTSQPINIQAKSSGRSTKLASIAPTTSNFLPASNNGNTLLSGHNPSKTITTRCDSRDSGIATPSGSHPTIFAFSPSSPKKPFIVPTSTMLSELSPPSLQETTTASITEECEVPRKCFIDATGGSMRLSESEDERSSKIVTSDFSQSTTTSANAKKSYDECQLDDLSNEYADMTLAAPQSKKPNLNLPLKPVEYSEYMNYTPKAAQSVSSTTAAAMPTPTAAPNKQSHVDDGDYAIMHPSLTRKLLPLHQRGGAQTITNTASAISPPAPILTQKSMLLTSQEKMTAGYFRPIRDQDTNIQNNSSPKPVYSQNRQFAHKRSSIPTTTQEEPARTSQSRPNSVNSEKISSSSNSLNSTTRPNSANSEQLQQILSTSSSSSTLCESGSKSQSPSSTCTVRQYSFNDNTNNSCSANTSRPESVTSDPYLTSRPPSVTSERTELHYASLDLPPACGVLSSSLLSTAKMEVDEQKGDSSTSSSPNMNCQPSAFTYAKIDFIKSDNLKALQQQHQP